MSAREPPAYYMVRPDGSFTPTKATQGPWNPKLQHGGPPSALLGRALEQEAARRGLPFVSRVTTHLLRPVPVDATLSVQVEPIRLGAKVGHLSAKLHATTNLKSNDSDINKAKVPAAAAGPKLLAYATAVCCKTGPLDGVPPEPSDQAIVLPPPPESVKPFVPPFTVGWMKSMTMRMTKGTLGHGPTEVWAKVDLPLVHKDALLSPLQRTLVFGDGCGGLSFYLDFMAYTFLNSDFTVNFLRHPEGEWICMRARTDLSASTSTGLASAELFDRTGFFGRISQQQILEARL